MLEEVRETGLLTAGRSVLVLLSGGRDSVALLDLAVRLVGADEVRALHVNYGLREGADDDQAHCVRLCEMLGVGLEIRRPRRSEPGNLQDWARRERYAAATELAGRDGADIAAGHTATDQVETILYRLASSPSRRALLGMKAREGILVRPLLGFTREATAAYCRERGLAWREDETNASPVYARGRVRHGLVPALEAVHPAAVANVLSLANVLRDEAQVLDALVDEVLQGVTEIEVARLGALAPALGRLVVQRLADAAARGPAPGAARRLDELLALPGTAALDLPHGVRAVVTRGVLRFESRPKGARPPAASAPHKINR